MSNAKWLREHAKWVDDTTERDILTAAADEIDRLASECDEACAEAGRLADALDTLRDALQGVIDAEDKAWKPVQVFRTDAQVEADEAIHAAIGTLADDARAAMLAADKALEDKSNG